MSVQTLQYDCPHCDTRVEVPPCTDSEVMVCPNPACGKPFRIDVPQAAPAAQLVVPESAKAALPAEEPPRAATLAEREEELERVHLHMFRRYPFRTSGFVVVALGGLVAGLVAWARDWWLVSFLAWAACLFAVVRLARWWFQMKQTTFTLTTKRCVVESGMVTKQTTEMPLAEVGEVTVNQGILTKLLDVGDLVLVSNQAEGRRIVVMAVPHPDLLATRIRSGREPAGTVTTSST